MYRKTRVMITWNISSLWDSKVCSFILRFLRSQSATVCKCGNKGTAVGKQHGGDCVEYLVCRACGQNILRIGIECQTIHLRVVDVVICVDHIRS